MRGPSSYAEMPSGVAAVFRVDFRDRIAYFGFDVMIQPHCRITVLSNTEEVVCHGRLGRLGWVDSGVWWGGGQDRLLVELHA